MAGARPLALSLALILEEGLELTVLRRLLASLAATARQCGVQVITGDTKVVERGKADRAFLTTSGIGLLSPGEPIDPGRIRPGDQLVVSGDLGRHGMAILAVRHGLDLHPPLLSDCAPLWPLVERLLEAGVRPHCLRDLTRGGLASALQELALEAAVVFHLIEERIPIAMAVARSAALLGLDPLQLANEGRMVAVVAPTDLDATLAVLEPGGGSWIGTVERPDPPLEPPPGPPLGSTLSAGRAGSPGLAQVARVILRTRFGSERMLLPLSGEQVPRIC
jgi:hydrogenase expression/formation protein HypE